MTTLPEETLKQLEQTISKIPGAFNLTFEQGKYIYNLALQHKCKHALELGTSYGYSTLFLSYACDKVTSVEKDARKIPLAQKHFKQFDQKNITLLNTTIQHYLTTLKQEHQEPFDPFDLVFLDAEKKQYTNYLQQLLPYLTSGALIIADDLHMQEKIENFLEYIHSNPFFTNIKQDQDMLTCIYSPET